MSDANDLQSSSTTHSSCGTHSRTQIHKVTASVSVRRGRPSLEAEQGANTFSKIPLARESGPEPSRECRGIKGVRSHQLCSGECCPIKGAQGVQGVQGAQGVQHQGRAAESGSEATRECCHQGSASRACCPEASRESCVTASVRRKGPSLEAELGATAFKFNKVSHQ